MARNTQEVRCMEQETRGCVSRVTRVPGGKYPIPAIPEPPPHGSTAAPGHGSRHSGQRDSVSGRLASPTPPRRSTHPWTV